MKFSNSELTDIRRSPVGDALYVHDVALDLALVAQAVDAEEHVLLLVEIGRHADARRWKVLKEGDVR